MKKFLSTFACVALIASTATPTFAASGKNVELTNEYIQKVGTTEYVEGGTWFHDVTTSGNIKSVVSNYQHNSKRHSSACDIGGYNKVSHEEKAGTESKSSTSGNKSLGTAHASYNTYEN